MSSTINTELFDLLKDLLGLVTTATKPEDNNFYLYQLPSTKQVPTKVWWLIPQAQNLSNRLVTGERDYLDTFLLYYRSSNPKDVDVQTNMAQELINGLKCFNLPNYNVVYCRASTTNPDEDLDEENMWRGSVVITLRSIQDSRWIESF